MSEAQGFYPEHHTQFSSEAAAKDELDASLRESIVHLREAMQNQDIADAELGYALGTSLGNALNRLYAERKSMPREDYVKGCRKAHAVFGALIEDRLHQDYDKYRSGFIAELGAKRAFSEGGYSVFEGTMHEDTRESVDFWIDLGKAIPEDVGKPAKYTGVRYLAVQVKTVATEVNPTRCLYPVESGQQLQEDLFRHYKDLTEHQEDGILNSCRVMFEYCNKQNWNGPEGGLIQPLVVVLPSSGSDYGMFNRVTGECAPGVQERLIVELEDTVVYATKEKEKEAIHGLT